MALMCAMGWKRFGKTAMGPLVALAFLASTIDEADAEFLTFEYLGMQVQHGYPSASVDTAYIFGDISISPGWMYVSLDIERPYNAHGETRFISSSPELPDKFYYVDFGITYFGVIGRMSFTDGPAGYYGYTFLPDGSVRDSRITIVIRSVDWENPTTHTYHFDLGFHLDGYPPEPGPGPGPGPSVPEPASLLSGGVGFLVLGVLARGRSRRRRLRRGQAA